ncbi:MAG: serine/threonine-protein kinase [Lysobacter sp.]
MADRLPPSDTGRDRADGERTPWWRTTRLVGRLFPTGAFPSSLSPTADRTATSSGRRSIDEPPEFDFDDPDQCEFGGYQLRALLGGGGAGWIYRARQRSLDRDVALKLLSGGLWAAPEGVDRLRHEAQDAASLKHPNIVTVYEVGEQHGRIYYAMELVEGRNLGERIRQQGPLPAREAATLVRVLAEAVDYAHRLGVLHLDLNPTNVLLGTDGVPKIADFGLARRVADGDSVPNERVSGTPGYIAPEQVQLHLGRLCAATDVWGLGAVLYQALTGHAPFEAGSARSTIELVLQGRVRDPGRYRHDLPRDLRAICLHCLHKHPIARYASARGLADDLGRFLEDREVWVRPLNPLQRGWRWMRRDPRLALAVLLAALSLIVALAVLLAPPLL